MTWWQVSYWLFAIGCLGVFVARRIRLRRRSDTDAKAADATANAPIDPRTKVWAPPPPPDPHDETFRLDPTQVSTSGSQMPTADPSDQSGADPSLPSVTPPSPTGPATTPTGPTLPELLSGITLPHELVPLTQSDLGVDVATHIVVATQKASAEVVRQGLCDELDRLGYTIEQESMLRLTAIGPRGVVKVDIHADAATVHVGGARRFPTALEGSVVVELRVG